MWVSAPWSTYPQISPPTLFDWGSDKQSWGYIEIQNCIPCIRNILMTNIKCQNAFLLFCFFPWTSNYHFSYKNGRNFSWSCMTRIKNISMKYVFGMNSAISIYFKITNFDVEIAKFIAWEMKQMVSLFPGQPVDLYMHTHRTFLAFPKDMTSMDRAPCEQNLFDENRTLSAYHD